MKLQRTFQLVALLGFAAALLLPAHAQIKPAAKPSALASAIDKEITSLENQLVSTAEAMPEDKFNASPETLNLQGSEFKGVRTFATQVRHLAADNFAIWAPLTGQPEPEGINAPNGPETMKGRAEIIQFLKDSFVFAHKAAASLTSENALELVEFRRNKVTRMSLIILAFSHASDHYGQMVEYLRFSGIVPPASRPGRVLDLQPPRDIVLICNL